jgi:hypothetical protein
MMPRRNDNALPPSKQKRRKKRKNNRTSARFDRNRRLHQRTD